jgi:hypothetical protein
MNANSSPIFSVGQKVVCINDALPRQFQSLSRSEHNGTGREIVVRTFARAETEFVF